MKSPDEIKKGLEYLSITNVAQKVETAKKGLPYAYTEEVAADAIALIQQLEAQNAELLEEVEQLEAEHAALLNDLKDADMTECEHCKHYRINDPECSCKCGTCINPCPCNECYHNNLWQWRGVKKEETP